MTVRTMRCRHSDPLCADCKKELDALGQPDIRQQLVAITIRLDTGGYLGYGGAAQAATELLALISQTVKTIVGESQPLEIKDPTGITDDELVISTRNRLIVEQYTRAQRLLGRET